MQVLLIARISLKQFFKAKAASQGWWSQTFSNQHKHEECS